MPRPQIGITCDHERYNDAHGAPRTRFFCDGAYVAAVSAAGGSPLLLTYGSTECLPHLHGIVISGGNFDIPPEDYGGAAAPGLRQLKPERSRFERSLALAALAGGVPLLGVCGGMQLLNVVCGGTLHQHVDGHEQPSDRGEPFHSVRLSGDLGECLGATVLAVNSTHHQAVDRLGAELRVSAVAADGVIEGIEHARTWAWGVQWHPEALAEPRQLAIYRAFVAAAEKLVKSP